MTIKSITAGNCETSLATRSEDRRLYSQSTEFAVACIFPNVCAAYLNTFSGWSETMRIESLNLQIITFMKFHSREFK